MMNRRRKKLLVYTDSRGFYVNRWYCKKNPLYSYIGALSEKYCVDYRLCGYKHTTLLDFLCDYREGLADGGYDAVILHLGVVDFSPRTERQARHVLRQKEERLRRVFGRKVPSLSVEPYPGEPYDGEPTASMYSKEFLRDFIVDQVNAIDGTVVWIGVNPVLGDWDGNYTKRRPQNMNRILEYQEVVDAHFRGERIALQGLTPEEIKRYTVDNIHLSLDGFHYLEGLIEEKLERAGKGQ